MARDPISVTQLNGYIKGVFEDELVLHNIAVYGEIFECSVSGSTTFLTLKDGECSLRCLRYNSNAKHEVGMKVLLTGTVTFYARSGRVDFVYRDIQPYGESLLYAEFLRLKAGLEAEGVFSDKPPLPAAIRRVALVTSLTGAVLHDFFTVMKTRGACAGIVVYPVKVQGDDAADMIAAAVNEINEKISVDAIVVARGGGANTDLAPFNTEAVARAVGSSRIPVISAVGHETDYTLCDFAATVRAATPSVAAAIVAQSGEVAARRISAAMAAADAAVNRKLRGRTGALSSLASRIEQAAERKNAAVRLSVISAADRCGENVRRLYNRALGALSAAANGLSVAAADKVTSAENALKMTAVRTESVNPLKILNTGYAKVYRDGNAVDGVNELRGGDGVRVVMRDGAFGARVEYIDRSDDAKVGQKE